MLPTPSSQARTVTRITRIGLPPGTGWRPPDNPFLSHAFLDAAEASRSATEKTGWQPFHCRLESGGRLIGAAPLYVKSHSYGEYVFDHGWAEGYRRAGGSYYPKLLVAVPFTPVPGPRLLAENERGAGDADREPEGGHPPARPSSLHVNFCTAEEAEALERGGFLIRRGIQFHWENQSYPTFEAWLDASRAPSAKWSARSASRCGRPGSRIEAVHGEALAPSLLTSSSLLPRHCRQALGQRLPQPRLLSPPWAPACATAWC